MIVNNINRSNYSLYKTQTNKQTPSFGFRLGLNLRPNPERVKNGLIHEGVNLGIGAFLSQAANLPLLESFVIVKTVKDVLMTAKNYVFAPTNFKLQKMIMKYDYPSNMFRPAMAAVDSLGDKLIAKFKKPI